MPPLSVALPKISSPSLKVTVPVAPVPETVAVKVTDCPQTEGLAEERMAVVVVDASVTLIVMFSESVRLPSETSKWTLR